MNWTHFICFALPSVIFWSIGAILAYKNSRRIYAVLFTIVGLLIYSSYITGMWLSLERPPLRTMGETRLWYSFFLAISGLITYLRWRYKWILSFSTIVAFVFIMVNILKPEIHSKTLMPALQSAWFAPHVIVYMFAYAMLGAATVVALYFLILLKKRGVTVKMMDMLDNFIYVGVSFLTIGMLFGALWAKEAWGHYWSWDPKETWAAATWLSYLIYIHFRYHRPYQLKITLSIVLFSFLLLQICWFGVNYLPSAKGSSVHTYSSEG